MKALNIKQVMDKVGLGKSTIYRMITAGDFPKPFVLVGNRTAWVDEDVDEWIAARAGRAPSGRRDEAPAVHQQAGAQCG